MGEYLADFRSRALPAALAPYFVRASSGTDKDLAGVYSTVLSGVPAFDGADGLILETASTTPLLWSSGFDNANWGKHNATAAADSGTAPSVSGFSELIVPSVANQRHRVEQTVLVVVSTTYTYSGFFKAGGYTIVALREGNVTGAYAQFDLTAGTVRSQGNGGVGTIVSLGDGWYRCSMTMTTTGAQTSYKADVYVLSSAQATSDPGNLLWVADGVSGIYGFDAQLEALPCATSPIPTTTAAVTRALAYLGRIPLTALGLASQNNEFTAHFGVKVPFSSAVDLGGRSYFGLSNAGQTQWMSIDFPAAGTVRLNTVIGAGSPFIDISGLTWAAGDVLNVRFAKGAAAGLILRVDESVGTNSGAGAKAVFSSAIADMNLNGRPTNLSASGLGFGTFRGFKVWGRALSDAELSALTLESLNQRVGSKYTMGLGLGLGL